MNPFLWNLLGVKYILAERRMFEQSEPLFRSTTGALIYANPSALPRAFFVRHAAVASDVAILMRLQAGDFDPRDTVFLEQPLPAAVVPPDSGAFVQLVEKSFHYQRYRVRATGSNLLFLSEIYYPVSWHAYVDGNEVPIYKANFAFRAVLVPPGEHTLEFRFTSPAFEKGKAISMASTAIVLLAIAGLLWQFWRTRRARASSSA
jgi:hypothetical protein